MITFRCPRVRVITSELNIDYFLTVIFGTEHFSWEQSSSSEPGAQPQQAVVRNIKSLIRISAINHCKFNANYDKFSQRKFEGLNEIIFSYFEYEWKHETLLQNFWNSLYTLRCDWLVLVNFQRSKCSAYAVLTFHWSYCRLDNFPMTLGVRSQVVFRIWFSDKAPPTNLPQLLASQLRNSHCQFLIPSLTPETRENIFPVIWRIQIKSNSQKLLF